MKTTIPAFGLDLLSRSSRISVSTRSVSPWKTGAGKRISSQPRLAIDVPSVVCHGDPDHQAQGKAGIDDALAEFGFLPAIFFVEMKLCRVMGQRCHEQVIGLGHRAPDGVLEDLSDMHFVKE